MDGGGDETAGGPVRSATRTVPEVSSRAVLAAFDGPRVAWTAPGGLEVAGVGAAARLTATGSGRFGTVRDRGRALFAEVDHDGPAVARPRAFGGFAFHDGHQPTGAWTGFPAAEFVVPAVQVTRTDGATHLTVTTTDPAVDLADRLGTVGERLSELPAMLPAERPPGVVGRRFAASERAYGEAVSRAAARVRAGDLRKVVLGTALTVDTDGPVDAPAVLERLRRSYPDCFRFLLAPGEAAFFGAPPERLARLEGRRVETEALAGSVARGATPEEDDALAATLTDDRKLRREQGLVVDTVAERLERLGDVEVGRRRVRRLATIQHLRTPIRARLDRPGHVLDVVETLHPTPAVGGLPPATALQTIRDTEAFDRGWYAAPVGWFDADGDGEFAVAIRSAVGADRRVTLFGGNGIVGDSDPEEEWAEVRLKFRPILDELDREDGGHAGGPAPGDDARRAPTGEAPTGERESSAVGGPEVVEDAPTGDDPATDGPRR
jgi:menaquinone-specific isochorismate synthase